MVWKVDENDEYLLGPEMCEKQIFSKNINTLDFTSIRRLNPIALRTAKTLWSFGHSIHAISSYCQSGSLVPNFCEI